MYLKAKSQMGTTKLCYSLCPGGRHPGPHFASHVFWKITGRLMPFLSELKRSATDLPEVLRFLSSTNPKISYFSHPLLQQGFVRQNNRDALS